jgi:hypothetical protein
MGSREFWILGQYMLARQIERKPKTNVYGVFSTHHGDELGTVKWHGPWRQYCFFLPRDLPDFEIVLSASCLQDLVKFLKELNEKKRDELK